MYMYTYMRCTRTAVLDGAINRLALLGSGREALLAAYYSCWADDNHAEDCFDTGADCYRGCGFRTGVQRHGRIFVHVCEERGLRDIVLRLQRAWNVDKLAAPTGGVS